MTGWDDLVRSIRQTPIRISEDMLRRTSPDLLALQRARVNGERPDCSCRPIKAAGGLLDLVVGYHDECDQHRSAREAQEEN